MIKVILERHCHPDKAAELENLLVDLRTKAVQQRGYVSGETLRSVDDPSYWLVISTWLDIDLWKAWETSAERREIASRLEPLLAAPEKISIFSFVWEACWWPPELQRFDRVAKSQAKLRAP